MALLAGVLVDNVVEALGAAQLIIASCRPRRPPPEDLVVSHWSSRQGRRCERTTVLPARRLDHPLIL
jgi:hypothetical protein